MNKKEELDKSLAWGIFGAIALYFLGDQDVGTDLVKWIRAVAWFAVLANGLGFFVYIVWRYVKWIFNRAKIARVNRPINEAKGQGNPFASLLFINGVVLTVIGLAWLIALQWLIQNSGNSALFRYLNEASQFIGWPILSNLYLFWGVVLICGVVCLAFPFLRALRHVLNISAFSRMAGRAHSMGSSWFGSARAASGAGTKYRTSTTGADMKGPATSFAGRMGEAIRQARAEASQGSFDEFLDPNFKPNPKRRRGSFDEFLYEQ